MIEVSEKVRNKTKDNSYNKEIEDERIPTEIPKVSISHREVHTRDKEPTDVMYVANKVYERGQEDYAVYR